jgi:hypothetical protein
MFTAEMGPSDGVTSIERASVTTSYIEKARIHRGNTTIRLNDTLQYHQHAAAFQAIKLTATVRYFNLESVLLDTDTLMLLSRGHPISETAFAIPSHLSDRPAVDPHALIELENREDIIIGYNNAYNGYQHWLIQCLPAIDWSLRQARTHEVRLVLPPLADWQEDLLDLLGYRALPRLEPRPGKQYLLPRVGYAEHVNGSTTYRICLSALDTARRILSRVPPIRSPYNVIYVLELDLYYGSIQNIAEILDLLQRRGVFVVDHTRLSTAQRINMFRHADVVLGPLSGRLADILFCTPGTLLWEWMPTHHVNPFVNRLAQTAGMDYWADMFQSVAGGERLGEWVVDLDVVAARLSEISTRLALRSIENSPTVSLSRGDPDLGRGVTKPIDELLLAFESLGDNCEFGLVQRAGGVDPLGLLRFAGISIHRLIDGIKRGFEGLGTFDTITVEVGPDPRWAEYMVTESLYGLRYHSGVMAGEMGADDLRRREARRLPFLSRKLLEDLEVGEKICVWKSPGTSELTQVYPLLSALRSRGRTTLLWVVQSDGEQIPGTLELLDDDFIKGYIGRFAPYDNAGDIQADSWFELCQRAYHLVHPEELEPTRAAAVDFEPLQIFSAMKILAQNPAVVQPTNSVRANSNKGVLSRFWGWLGS